MTTSSFGFPRTRRLRRSQDFRRVQRSGRRIRQRDLVVLYLPGDETCTRVGLTVSRKVGNAVVRNRVKRWLRDAARHELPALDRAQRERQGLDTSAAAHTWDIVFIARPSAANSGALALRQQVADALQRLARPRPLRSGRRRRS